MIARGVVAALVVVPGVTGDDDGDGPTARTDASPGARSPKPTTPTGFASSLRVARGILGPEGRLLTLRLDDDGLQVVGADSAGDGKVVVVRPGQPPHDLPGPDALPRRSSFTLRAVDTRAPVRIRRAVRRRQGRDARLTYYALSREPIEGRMIWSAFVDGGSQGYTANGTGRRMRPLGAGG